MSENNLPHQIREKVTLYGNLATSGGSIVLLVTALNVLSQHGDEFNVIRERMLIMRSEHEHIESTLRADLAELKLELANVRNRVTNVERLLREPQARPDAWTGTDDRTRMDAFERKVESMIKDHRADN